MPSSETDEEKEEREQVKRLDELYQLLRRYRDYILSKFDDLDMSDDEYFKYGISYDIVNNALNIVMCGLSRDPVSIGIDNNARAILEAFMILEIDKSGQIDWKMKRIYRLSYSAVEYSNEEYIPQGAIVSGSDEAMRKEDYDELIDICCEHFDCKKKVLLENYGIGSPYLFLMKDIADKTSFESVIHKYHISISKEFNDAYDFFSLFVHPSFIIYDQERIYEKREEYLTALFPYILDYIDKEFPPLEAKNVQSALSFVFYSKDGKELESALSRVNAIIKHLYNLIPENADPFTRYLLPHFANLISDALNCYYFKLDDLVTPKFKSLVEYYSVCLYFMGISDEREYVSRLDGLYLGTLFRFKRWESDFTGDKDINDLIEDVYMNFYGKRYSVNGINNFKYNLENQLLYFVNQKNYPYAHLVKKEISKNEFSEEEIKRVNSLYKVSLDMEHASGYVFNQSADVSEYYALETLSVMYTLLAHLLTHYDLDLKSSDPAYKGLESEISYATKKARDYEKKGKNIIKNK